MKMKYREGDILISYSEIKKKYNINKVLHVDVYPDQIVYNCRAYNPVSEKPKLSDVKNMGILIRHYILTNFNLDLSAVEILGNIPVSEEELEDYKAYLK